MLNVKVFKDLYSNNQFLVKQNEKKINFFKIKLKKKRKKS